MCALEDLDLQDPIPPSGVLECLCDLGPDGVVLFSRLQSLIF